MKIITTEEHFLDQEISASYQDVMQKLAPHFLEAYNQGDAYSPSFEELQDLGALRVADMDKHGIDMQVLSYSAPGVQMVEPSEAVPLAQKANDMLSSAIESYPDRFAGFATLPTTAPEKAADELTRTVTELGFKGAMINGRTSDLFLDHASFDPILETASELNVPIYLHPTVPPRNVQESYYIGLDPVVSTRLATAGWGWHNETGIHAVRMILGGIFDKYPNLQVMLGHWGEMVTFFLDRIHGTLNPVSENLERSITEYFQQNFYVTPSGLFSIPSLQHALQILGADRIIYSVDYPYVPNDGAREFLESAPISKTDKHKIAHGNAEQLLDL